MPRGKSSTTKKTSPKDEVKTWDFATYAKITGQMIQNPAWANEIMRQVTTLNAKKYTKEQISEWIENIKSYQSELLEVHQYLMYASPHYMRLVKYYGSLLTFDYILIPTTSKIDDKVTKAYDKSLDFLERLDIKTEFSKIHEVISAEDTGFYYLRDNGDKWTFQRLPSSYCQLVGYTDIGYKYVFDLTFFDKQGIKLEEYPEELVLAYHQFKSNSKNASKYYMPGDRGVAFKFNEETSLIVPPWVGLFIDSLDIQNYKELNVTREQLDNWKLLTQRIPTRNDKDAKVNDFLIDLESAGKFHNAVKSNLPPGVGVVTTPMPIEPINMEKRQNNETLIGVGEKNFYNSSGTSALLFNSDSSGSKGLERSIQTDEMLVIQLYRQYEKYINYWLSKVNRGRIKLWFPDITYTNRSEKLDMFRKNAEYGFPKSLVACASGMTPSQFNNLTAFENHVNLINNLRPLKSSHTTSGNDEGGRPTKDIKDLSDSGEQTRDDEENENR